MEGRELDMEFEDLDYSLILVKILKPQHDFHLLITLTTSGNWCMNVPCTLLLLGSPKCDSWSSSTWKIDTCLER